MAQLGFDLSQTKAFGSYDIPDGTYNVKIISDEIKTHPKNGDDYLNLTYSVLDGTYANFKKFDELHLWHPDPEKRVIYMQKLKAIAEAIHHPNPNNIANSSELIGGVMTIILKTGINKNTGKEYQNIQRYKAIGEYEAAPKPPVAPAPKAQAQAQAQPSEAAPAQEAEKFPWE